MTSYELPNFASKDLVLVDEKMCARAKVQIDPVQIDAINKQIIKKSKANKGLCDHDKDDVMVRPKHPVPSGISVGMQIEFVCGTCESIVEPKKFETKQVS